MTTSKSKTTKTAKSKSTAKPKPQTSTRTSASELIDTKLTSVLEALYIALHDATIHRIDAHKELLARVAGSVAAGLVASPSPSIGTPSTMAIAAVDIAEEILKRIGLESTESVETSSLPGDEVDAAA